MDHEMGVAAAHLGAMGAKPKAAKPMKEFHAKMLHDGTFHVMMHHGRDQHGMEMKPPTEGSAPTLDGVHEHMHNHFAGGTEAGEKGGVTKGAEFNDGEAGGEKKTSAEKGKDTPEKDEKPEHGEKEKGGKKAEKESEE